jgi:hypothetical protein
MVDSLQFEQREIRNLVISTRLNVMVDFRRQSVTDLGNIYKVVSPNILIL